MTGELRASPMAKWRENGDVLVAKCTDEQKEEIKGFRWADPAVFIAAFLSMG